MTQSIIRFALIATVAICTVSPAFGQQAPAAEKQEVKTEVKQESKSGETKEVKTEAKEKEKTVTKKKTNEKECCQMKVRKL
ncbi:MAG: hypothetical protein HGA87_06240 [Desulfobulbaceae bacterium]|jgi:hypothetical protein|nr:hypothetical protein [Desulfobulbaceae bacterium]